MPFQNFDTTKLIKEFRENHEQEQENMSIYQHTFLSNQI